jgi:hypothetical protein
MWSWRPEFGQAIITLGSSAVVLEQVGRDLKPTLADFVGCSAYFRVLLTSFIR